MNITEKTHERAMANCNLMGEVLSEIYPEFRDTQYKEDLLQEGYEELVYILATHEEPTREEIRYLLKKSLTLYILRNINTLFTIPKDVLNQYQDVVDGMELGLEKNIACKHAGMSTQDFNKLRSILNNDSDIMSSTQNETDEELEIEDLTVSSVDEKVIDATYIAHVTEGLKNTFCSDSSYGLIIELIKQSKTIKQISQYTRIPYPQIKDIVEEIKKELCHYQDIEYQSMC